MKFLLGQRDEDQVDDNLYHVTPGRIVKIIYKLKQPPRYSPEPMKPYYLPPELLNIIFEFMLKDFLDGFNYELAVELLLVSRSVFIKFYNTYILPDKLISHQVSVGVKFYRMQRLLLTAERIYEKLYKSHGLIINLDMFLLPSVQQPIPMPWDIMTIKPFITLTTPVILKDGEIHTPHIIRFSNANGFLAGEFFQSVVTPTYFRLPIVVLALFDFTGSGPLITKKLLTESECWRSLFTILRKGLGSASGIYHSVNVASLPDEYIFHDEIYIES